MNHRNINQIPRDDEAYNLLMLLNMPEMLEARTLKEIHFAMKRAGYVEGEPGNIRGGWQRKYEGKSSDKKTRALIRTADGKLIELCIGDDGHYSLAVLIENADAITRKERAPAKQFVSGCRTHLSKMFVEGPKFKEAADALLGTSASQVENESQSILQRLSNLLGKKEE